MLIFLSMLESDEERRLFTDLYNQYGNMMLHVAKRYFPKDMYAAEDVVQNAWIRVVDHFQKIQAVPSKKRGAYLVVIVRNEAITALRKQKPELQFDENFVEGYIDLENDNTRSIIDTIGIPQELPNNTEIIYENSDGEILRFEYMRVEEGSAIIIDAENMEVTEIGVNGCPGHLYISVDPEQSNCITWYDNGAKMQFIIDGFLEGNELQKMAASVLQVD